MQLAEIKGNQLNIKHGNILLYKSVTTVIWFDSASEGGWAKQENVFWVGGNFLERNSSFELC